MGRNSAAAFGFRCECPTRRKWQHRSEPVQRLNRGFLIHAKHVSAAFCSTVDARRPRWRSTSMASAALAPTSAARSICSSIASAILRTAGACCRRVASAASAHHARLHLRSGYTWLTALTVRLQSGESVLLEVLFSKPTASVPHAARWSTQLTSDTAGYTWDGSAIMSRLEHITGNTATL